MAYYRFESEWIVTAPVDKVFDVLVDFESYGAWWPSFHKVKVARGGDSGVGTRVTYLMKSPLFYSLRSAFSTTEIERPSRIQVAATGDLAGSGTYLLEPDGKNTSIRYLWNVSTTKRWMNIVAPVMRPLFVWAHHSVMREGGAGLAARLGARLVACHSGVATAPPTRESSSDVLS